MAFINQMTNEKLSNQMGNTMKILLSMYSLDRNKLNVRAFLHPCQPGSN